MGLTINPGRRPQRQDTPSKKLPVPLRKDGEPPARRARQKNSMTSTSSSCRRRNRLPGLIGLAGMLALLPRLAAAEELRDVNDRKVDPLARRGQKATVFFFVLSDCPIANAYAPEIKRICAEYARKKVNCYLVYADADLPAAAARKHVREFGYTCPALLDDHHVLVKLTGATVTPEAAVLSPEGKVLYRGRIDDLYTDYGKRRIKPSQRDLRNALDAVVEGKPVPTATTKAIGCFIPLKK